MLIAELAEVESDYVVDYLSSALGLCLLKVHARCTVLDGQGRRVILITDMTMPDLTGIRKYLCKPLMGNLFTRALREVLDSRSSCRQ